MLELPQFAEEEDAADWFATHGTAPYMDKLERVTEAIPVVRSNAKKTPSGLRIRGDDLEAPDLLGPPAPTR